jgi:hypothetical protein
VSRTVPALVTHRLLQTAPWLLDGLSHQTAVKLERIYGLPPREWAPVCKGLPKPATVARLLEWPIPCLLTFPRFGRKTLDDLVQTLAAHSLELPPRWVDA